MRTSTLATARPPSRLTLARVGRNESLASGPPGEERPAGDRLLRFRCECEGERCVQRLLLRCADYAWVRTHADWLIVAPGHVVAGAVVEQRLPGCVIVRSLRRGAR